MLISYVYVYVKALALPRLVEFEFIFALIVVSLDLSTRLNQSTHIVQILTTFSGRTFFLAFVLVNILPLESCKDCLEWNGLSSWH